MHVLYAGINALKEDVELIAVEKHTLEQCGISFSDRIIGGLNASLGQYPWMARLGYTSKIF